MIPLVTKRPSSVATYGVAVTSDDVGWKENLRSVMNVRGLTYGKLSAASEIPVSTIKNWFKKDDPPDPGIETLTRIARALEIEVVDLLRDGEPVAGTSPLLAVADALRVAAARLESAAKAEALLIASRRPRPSSTPQAEIESTRRRKASSG